MFAKRSLCEQPLLQTPTADVTGAEAPAKYVLYKDDSMLLTSKLDIAVPLNRFTGIRDFELLLSSLLTGYLITICFASCVS